VLVAAAVLLLVAVRKTCRGQVVLVVHCGNSTVLPFVAFPGSALKRMGTWSKFHFSLSDFSRLWY